MKYEAPAGAKYQSFQATYKKGVTDYDIELYVNIEFDDGSKITNMSVSDPDLPGIMVYKISDGTHTFVLEEGASFDYLVNAGVLSGVYDLIAEFRLDKDKSQANAKLADFGSHDSTCTETFDDQFAFSAYFPVVFEDHKDIASYSSDAKKPTVDADKTTVLTIPNGAITNNYFLPAAIGGGLEAKIGTVTDQWNFFKIQSTVKDQKIQNAEPSATEKNPVFGYVWLRASTNALYQGKLNNINYGGTALPTRGTSQSPNTFVFEKWTAAEGTTSLNNAAYVLSTSTSGNLTKATNNVLMANYVIGNSYKLGSITSGFIPVPVGFKFPYKENATVTEKTLTSKYEMQAASNNSYVNWANVLNSININANRKYSYYGYADKTKVFMPTLNVGLINIGEIADYNEGSCEGKVMGILSRYVEGEKISKTASENGYTVAARATTSNSSRMVDVTYNDQLYPNTTPDLVYSYRVYHGTVSESEPMYISIENPQSIKKFVGQSNDTVAAYLSSVAPSFKIRNSRNAALGVSPTLSLVNSAGATITSTSSRLNELPRGHYLVVASYTTTSDSTHVLKASFAITLNNMILDWNGVDREVNGTKVVYMGEGAGNKSFRLPTRIEWQYAMSFQTNNSGAGASYYSGCGVSNYAFPYILDHWQVEYSTTLGFTIWGNSNPCAEWFVDNTTGSFTADGVSRTVVKPMWINHYAATFVDDGAYFNTLYTNETVTAGTTAAFRLIREY